MPSIYLHAAQAQVEAASFPDAEDIRPCTPEEVDALQAKFGRPLPGAVREFLLWCGKGLGEIWSGSRCLEYDELLSQFGLEAARAALEQAGEDASLLYDQALLFQMDEDGQFSFVRLDEGEDPPVYTFIEGEGQGLQRTGQRFSDYVHLIIRQEFGIADPVVEPAEPGPPGDGADRNILPAERRDLPDLREVSFNFLPPTVQAQLGTLRASFNPSAANMFAGAIFGGIFSVFGVVLAVFLIVQAAKAGFRMPIYADKSMSWVIFLVAEALSCGMIFMGALMLVRLRQNSGAKIFVGDQGLCRMCGSKYEVLPWRELSEIQELLIKDAAPLKNIGSLIPAGTDRSYNLRMQDGRELLFNATNVRKLALFAEILARVAELYQVPWNVTQTRRLS